MNYYKHEFGVGNCSQKNVSTRVCGKHSKTASSQF